MEGQLLIDLLCSSSVPHNPMILVHRCQKWRARATIIFGKKAPQAITIDHMSNKIYVYMQSFKRAKVPQKLLIERLVHLLATAKYCK